MRDRTTIAVRVSAVALGMFQLAGSFGAAGNQPARKPMDWLAVVLVLLGPAALAVRDRWPLAALGVAVVAADVYVALGYAFGPVFVAVVVGALTASHAGRRRATWLVVALGYVGFTVASVVDPRRSGSRLVQLSLVAGWLVVVLAVGEVIRYRRGQFAERARAEREERQRRLADGRLRLAQELHDVLAHNISLINVQAGVALHLLDEHPEQARPALANIKQASRDALQELRGALDVLRRGEDAPRAPSPTLADLDALVAGVRASGLDVRVDGAAPVPPLPAAVELAAYRIVQEALTNVTRHAGARSAVVRLRRLRAGSTGCGAAADADAADVDRLIVDVVDDGRGAAGCGTGDRPSGNGLTGMCERAAALGGSVDAGPSPGGGFRVHAVLPVSGDGGGA